MPNDRTNVRTEETKTIGISETWPIFASLPAGEGEGERGEGGEREHHGRFVPDGLMAYGLEWDPTTGLSVDGTSNGANVQRGTGKEKGTWGKWFTDGVAFARDTRLNFVSYVLIESKP